MVNVKVIIYSTIIVNYSTVISYASPHRLDYIFILYKIGVYHFESLDSTPLWDSR